MHLLVQNTDDIPKCWPWLFSLTGPDASSRELVKASRVKSNIVMKFFAIRYFELESLFFPYRISNSNSKLGWNAIRAKDQNRKQCSQCPKTFRSNSDRLRHEDGVHSKGRFPCEICGTILSAKSYLTIHMRRVHNKKKSEFESTKEPEESKGFDCEYCDKSYSSEHSLRRHIQVVHKKDQVCKCDVCGATFARLRSLSQHKEKVHDAEMEKGITMETLPSKSAWNKVFSRNVKAEQSVKTKSEFPKQQIIFEDLSSRDSLQSEPMLRTSFQVAPNQSIKLDYDAFQPPTSNVTFKCVNCNYKALTQMDIIKHNIFQHTQWI